MKSKHARRGRVVLYRGKRISLIAPSPKSGEWWAQPAEGGKPFTYSIHVKDMQEVAA